MKQVFVIFVAKSYSSRAVGRAVGRADGGTAMADRDHRKSFGRACHVPTPCSLQTWVFSKPLAIARPNRVFETTAQRN